jgi:hypothetical protein
MNISVNFISKEDHIFVKKSKVIKLKVKKIESSIHKHNDIEELVISLSFNFTKIISRKEIKKYEIINWGNNGIGDRWANKKFNYSVIYKNNVKTYSENEEEKLPDFEIKEFQKNNIKEKGILGIFVHSKRLNIKNRPIKKEIEREIKKQKCVCCGSSSDIICDHKNDLYNEDRVLDTNKQTILDFQALCNHCNLQKRQISKNEIKKNKIYSAKNIPQFKIYPFEFPWEKKVLNLSDITTKIDTYWYDPIEFNNKLYKYITITLPINREIKSLKKIIG